MRVNCKLLIKLISIILIALLMFNFSTVVYAENGLIDFNEFEEGNDKTPESVKNMVNTSTGTVITILRIAGIAIASIMLLAIAMRYMFSSAGDRADIKKHAIAYVVGAIILFGVTGILGILVDISNSFNVS